MYKTVQVKHYTVVVNPSFYLYIPRTISFYRQCQKEYMIHRHAQFSAPSPCEIPFNCCGGVGHLYLDLNACTVSLMVWQKKKHCKLNPSILWLLYNFMLLISNLCHYPLCITDCSVYVPKDVYFQRKKNKRQRFTAFFPLCSYMDNTALFWHCLAAWRCVWPYLVTRPLPFSTQELLAYGRVRRLSVCRGNSMGQLKCQKSWTVSRVLQTTGSRHLLHPVWC